MLSNAFLCTIFIRSACYTLCNTHMATSPIQPLQMNLDVCNTKTLYPELWIQFFFMQFYRHNSYEKLVTSYLSPPSGNSSFWVFRPSHLQFSNILPFRMAHSRCLLANIDSEWNFFKLRTVPELIKVFIGTFSKKVLSVAFWRSSWTCSIGSDERVLMNKPWWNPLAPVDHRHTQLTVRTL